MVVWIRLSGKALTVKMLDQMEYQNEQLSFRVWCQETGGTLAIFDDHQDLLTKVHVHKSETLFTI